MENKHQHASKFPVSAGIGVEADSAVDVEGIGAGAKAEAGEDSTATVTVIDLKPGSSGRGTPALLFPLNHDRTDARRQA